MITTLEAIQTRHSVRSYIDKPIKQEIIDELLNEIQRCNKESELHIQLIANDHAAFTGIKAMFGKFKGVQNYLAIVGKKSADLNEKAGYYGQCVVLMAQQLGLNSCWVGATYNKSKCHVSITNNEVLVCVIALGYGTTQGKSHKSKDMSRLCKFEGEIPEWFQKGMEAALFAPTAMNKQDFLITLKDDLVSIETKETGYACIDKGILKYHFEKGAGSEMFHWHK